MDEWKGYLSYLDEGPYSFRIVTSILAPQVPPSQREKVTVSKLGYNLWPLQKKILSEMGDSTLILGLVADKSATTVGDDRSAFLFQASRCLHSPVSPRISSSTLESIKCHPDISDMLSAAWMALSASSKLIETLAGAPPREITSSYGRIRT